MMIQTMESPITAVTARPASRPPVLTVRNLSKKYGTRTVLHDVSFEVRPGEVFGFLGPNGAGKTTTLEIIEGLREYETGEITVFGMDHRKCLQEIRQRLGVSLQKSDYWGQLRMGELIDLFRGFYKKSLSRDYLLDTFDLRDKERAYLRHCSGGQRQRLVLALALVNDPDLIMLDEPTVGLDPEARRSLWNVILRLKEQGKAVILTTHYMEEARVLSDRVAIIHDGLIRCCDTPSALIAGLDSDSAILFRCDSPVDATELAVRPWCAGAMTTEKGETIVYSSDLKTTLFNLLNWAEGRSLKIEDLQIREPDLEDVYMRLTSGKRTEE